MLATVDRDGHRKWVYADIVFGFWRKWRALFSLGLIAFYLAIPWLSIGGNPFLRIDIPARQFTILGQVFWPQDIPYFLCFVLIGIVATLLMVSVLGRVFCGWLCPHNVILEHLYRPIEVLFEGRALRRRRRDAGETNDAVLPRKIAKYLVFILISGALANTATAVFIGTDGYLGGIIVDPIAHPSAAVFFVLFFAAIMFNFAWFREQTCTIVCPYGRIQAAMLDPDTLVVAYDENRGEPRGKATDPEAGDCVDCKRCIQVCPTGIDIRNGVQLECIHCTACIDACNDVMTKVHKPINLIGYTTENALAGKGRRLFRPRAALYAVVLTVLLSVTVALISGRTPLQITPLRTTTPESLVTLPDGREVVRKVVNLALVNKTPNDQTISFTTKDERATLFTRLNPLPLSGSEREQIVLILDYNRSDLADQVTTTEVLISSADYAEPLNVKVHAP